MVFKLLKKLYNKIRSFSRTKFLKCGPDMIFFKFCGPFSCFCFICGPRGSLSLTCLFYRNAKAIFSTISFQGVIECAYWHFRGPSSFFYFYGSTKPKRLRTTDLMHRNSGLHPHLATLLHFLSSLWALFHFFYLFWCCLFSFH